MKILWTDGSASPNPGPGGYAVIEQGENGAGRPVCLGGEADTTNIRMEGNALIEAIRYAGGEECQIHTDSEFWINVLTKWAKGWERRGWRKASGEIKNLDLVKKLYDLYNGSKAELVWVRGHVGTELNEMADEWANKARTGVRIEDVAEEGE